jgi:hypothetical protein
MVTLSVVEVRAMGQLARPSLQSFDYAQDDLALFLMLALSRATVKGTVMLPSTPPPPAP